MRNAFIAAAILTSSFAALADGEAFANPQAAGSTLTRAQVMGELTRQAGHGALASGEGPSLEAMQAAAAPRAARMASRAEVRAQIDMARRNGELGSGEFRSAAGTGRQG